MVGFHSKGRGPIDLGAGIKGTVPLRATRSLCEITGASNGS